MKKTIVFIMSNNYSGSHFLSQLLGSNTKAIHVGEVKNLIKKHRECHICGNTNNCDIFKGIEDIPKSEIYPTLMDRAPDETHVLIDNSKKAGWVEQFLTLQNQFDIKIIFLLRDPRALARRWALENKSTLKRLHDRFRIARRFIPQALPILFGDSVYTYAYKWLSHNKKTLEFIKHNNLEYKIVTYREVAFEKSETLKTLTQFIGLEFEKEQIDYWKFEHHGTQKPQYEWIKKQQNSSHVDLRWKDFLTKKQQSIIFNSKPLQQFFSDLHMKMGDEGLYIVRPN